jgi:hypothetical protein
MEILPLGLGFAAELRGVTLRDVAADDAAYAAVRAAFEEHSVLVFRGQDVTDEGNSPSRVASVCPRSPRSARRAPAHISPF